MQGQCLFGKLSKQSHVDSISSENINQNICKFYTYKPYLCVSHIMKWENTVYNNRRHQGPVPYETLLRRRLAALSLSFFSLNITFIRCGFQNFIWVIIWYIVFIVHVQRFLQWPVAVKQITRATNCPKA